MNHHRPTVTIIDYGSGNLLSVARAIEYAGATAQITHDPSEVDCAERLILPGVGSFDDGMQSLQDRGLIEPIRLYAASDRPLLGICLGMQMLANIGEEFGEHEGLGLIPGRVVPISPFDVDGLRQKVPHIGWADLSPARSEGWAGTLFDGTAAGAAVYLVHSFHFVPAEKADRLADCFYGGHRIVASVSKGRTIGCQFHPEKSGLVGINILRNFLRL